MVAYEFMQVGVKVRVVSEEDITAVHNGYAFLNGHRQLEMMSRRVVRVSDTISN